MAISEAFLVPLLRSAMDRVRDALGVLLVALGLAWTLVTRDKLGLVVAFAGVTLLAVDVLRPRRPRPDDGKEPPIF
jgi:uncharacterized RDD family membrane protein YckC